MGGEGKDLESAMTAALATILEPLVQIERATTWADAQSERFFDATYFGNTREPAWEVDFFLATDDKHHPEISHPRCLRGCGPSLAAALKDGLDKIYGEGS